MKELIKEYIGEVTLLAITITYIYITIHAIIKY